MKRAGIWSPANPFFECRELLLLIPPLLARVEILFLIHRQLGIDQKHQPFLGGFVLHLGDGFIAVRLPAVAPGDDAHQQVRFPSGAKALLHGGTGAGGEDLHPVPDHAGHGDGVLHELASFLVVEEGA